MAVPLLPQLPVDDAPAVNDALATLVDAVDVQLLELVTVTVYVPGASPLMIWLVPPFDQV